MNLTTLDGSLCCLLKKLQGQCLLGLRLCCFFLGYCTQQWPVIVVSDFAESMSHGALRLGPQKCGEAVVVTCPDAASLTECMHGLDESMLG